MTNAFITIKNNKVTVQLNGHSGYGTFGTDIVCAGISSLMFAFCETILQYADKNKVDLISYGSGDGAMDIAYTDEKGLTRSAIDMLHSGLSLIQENYPQNIYIEWAEIKHSSFVE